MVPRRPAWSVPCITRCAGPATTFLITSTLVSALVTYTYDADSWNSSGFINLTDQKATTNPHYYDQIVYKFTIDYVDDGRPASITSEYTWVL